MNEEIKQKDIGDIYEQFLEKESCYSAQFMKLNGICMPLLNRINFRRKTISLYSYQSINGLLYITFI